MFAIPQQNSCDHVNQRFVALYGIIWLVSEGRPITWPTGQVSHRPTVYKKEHLLDETGAMESPESMKAMS